MKASPGKKKTCVLDLTSIITPGLAVSYIVKNTWAVFENSGIWPFSRNAFSDEDLKVASVRCGGSSNSTS